MTNEMEFPKVPTDFGEVQFVFMGHDVVPLTPRAKAIMAFQEALDGFAQAVLSSRDATPERDAVIGLFFDALDGRLPPREGT